MQIFNSETGKQILNDKFAEISNGSKIRIIPDEKETVLGLSFISLINDIYLEWNKVNFLPNTTCEITILISKDIKQIDLLNIGIIAIFKARYYRVHFIFEFERAPGTANLLETNNSGPVFYKLMHYAGTSFLYSKVDLYSISLPGQSLLSYGKAATERRELWLNVADAYLPIFLLNPTKYISLFERPLSVDFNDHINLKYYIFEKRGGNNSDKIFQTIRKTIINKPDLNDENFSVLYYYRFLSKYNLLEVELNNSNFYKANKQLLREFSFIEGKIKPWAWREIDIIEYYKRARPLINRLHNRSAFFLILLCIVANNSIEKLPRKFNWLTVIKLLESSIRITEDLFMGIREIAKNTVEHSVNKLGILLARVFSMKEIKVLKRGELSGIENYINNFEEFTDFIDLNLLDISDKGITDTLTTTISNKLQREDIGEGARKQLIEDKEIVDAIGLDLGQLLSPNINFLNHQSTRAIASIGLQVFSHRINNYKGYFYASSPHIKGFQSVFYYNHLVGEPDTKTFYNIGTLYTVIFPIQNPNTNPPHIEENDLQAIQPDTPDEFSALMTFEYESKATPIEQKLLSKRHLVGFQFDYGNNQNKYISEYESVAILVDYCVAAAKKGVSVIPVLDCKNITNASQLYRTLSTIQFLHGIKDVCCISLKEMYFRELLSILLITGPGGPFWDAEKTVLFYINTVNDNMVLQNIPTIISGQKASTCNEINKKSTSHLLYTFNLFDLEDEFPYLDIISKSSLISPAGYLYNLDLLIRDGNETLFEQNMKALLNSNVLKN